MRSPDPGLPVWLDGAWTDDASAARVPWTEGLAAGLGAFETIGVLAGSCVDRAAHLKRLSETAALLGVALPSREELAVVASDLASRIEGAHGWIRIVAYRGGPVRVCGGGIAAEEIGRASTAVVLPWRRHSRELLAGRKCTSWAATILAEEEARRRGADDGLWSNQRGHLVEACTANLFLVRARKLFTADTRDGALPGIVRAHVIRAARDLGLHVHVGKIRRTRLREASEAFLTSAVRGVRPLVAVDGKPIGTGAPGSWTRGLSEVVATLRIVDERAVDAEGSRGGAATRTRAEAGR